MLYSWTITVTADKAEKTPKTQKLELSAGVITRVEIKFPAGCCDMVKTRIFHEEAQLVPTNRGGWVTGDDEVVTARLHHEIEKGLTFVHFNGASPGTSYPHTVTVRITVLPKIVATLIPLFDLLSKMFRRMGLIG